MKSALFVSKLGMTQLISEDGKVLPVSVLKVLDQEVLAVKSIDSDGYESVIVGFESVNQKSLNKPLLSFYKKIGKEPKKFIKELPLTVSSGDSEEQVADIVLNQSQFSVDDQVHVRGLSKGKGFQGTVKAHNFARGPMTHGSKNHRLPGSIGAGTDPARVFKGTRMAKRLGNKNVTVKNLKIVKSDTDNNLIYVSGSVPGKKFQYLLIYN